MATTTPRTPEETQAISRLRALGQGVRVYCLDRDQMYCVPAASGDGSAYQVQAGRRSTPWEHNDYIREPLQQRLGQLFTIQKRLGQLFTKMDLICPSNSGK